MKLTVVKCSSKTGPKVKSKHNECIVCGTLVTDENYNKSIGSNYCSWPCYEKNKQLITKPNCVCSICNKPMYLKPFRLKRVVHGVVCSNECKSIQKSNFMSGEGNHQHGLTGDKNASFIGIDRINQYGYNMKYLPNHPKADSAGRYREHRYVVETQGSYDDKYFDFIDGVKVLKDEYHIHHKDENKTNNNINNLEVLTQSEHSSLHCKTKTIIRDSVNGRIIGVLKQGELLESLEEDNQQPSDSSNTIEGSTTNSRVPSDKAGDSNANTSALQLSLF